LFAATDIVETKLGESYAKERQKILLVHNTTRRSSVVQKIFVMNLLMSLKPCVLQCKLMRQLM